MTLSPRPSARLSSIHQFAAHLRQAMHDIRHEDADEIALIHFWDDDSLFLPVRGFPVLVDDPKQDDRDVLAQALFASGFLGRVMLTAPHRNELLGQISSWQRSRVAQSDRRTRANFLRRRELNDVRRLIDFISKSAPLNESAAARAMGMLRELDPISFVYTQAVAGDWQQRLRDLVEGRGLIDLEVVGPDTGEVLDRGDLFDGFAARISNLRRGERALATAIDAAALTSVAIMNQAAQHGESPIYPRFFTSSPTIKRVLSDPWARDQLSFTYYDDSNVGHSTPVWRDSYYYVLRSIFSGLRLAPPGVAADRTGLDALSQLSRNLDAALRSGARDAFDYVDSAAFREDLSLSQVIEDLERSRMSRIWLSSPPRAVNGMLESLQSLLLADTQFALVDNFESLLRGQFNIHLEERRIAGEIRSALEHAPALLGTRERTKLSLNHDFAVVRWGLEFDPARDVLQLEHGASVALTELLELDDVGRMRRSRGAATRLLAILFGLEQFDLAREFLADLEISDEGPEISFMRFIANLMAPGGLSESDLDVIVKFVDKEWESLDDDEQVRFALAYGYALFAAWDRSSFGGVLPSRIKDEKGWASRSLHAVASRLDQMSEWPRAFGLNHVVYVATRAGLEIAQLPSLARDLASIAEKTQDFRFLDTVGLYLTNQALHLSPDDEAASAQGRKLAKRALSHLRKASKLVPEDREVEGHLEIAQEAQRRFASSVDSR